jgi:hypothetical protein
MDDTIDAGEEGEAMDAVGDDDAAMMAMMGMSGFGSTKVHHFVRRYSCTENALVRVNMSKATKKGA